MDPVNALFWNLVSGRKNPKMLPLRSRVDAESAYFAYRWRHRSTSHNNNNNGGLYACVPATEDIEPIGVTRAKYDVPLPLRWAKRIMDNRLAIFVFFLSYSTVSLHSACKLYAHAPSLLFRFLSISSATYRPGIWTTARWVVFNRSVWTQMFLKRCQGRRRKRNIVLVRVDMASDSSPGRLWFNFCSLHKALAISFLWPLCYTRPDWINLL